MSGFRWGQRSLDRLGGCHADIRRVADAALASSPFDLTVVTGFRKQAEQDEAFRVGRSKLRWPDSKHNHRDVLGDPCSLAVDLAPYLQPGWIPWGSKEEHGHTIAQQLRYWDILAGVVLGAAESLHIPMRWGGDWNRNGILVDQTFHDLPHFELLTN